MTRFSSDKYAFINDHCLEGLPVVPIVTVADLLFKDFPDINSFENLDLVKGIIDPQHREFSWKEKEDRKITLTDEDGHIYYKAQLPIHNIDHPIFETIHAGNLDQKPDYDFLFHGKRLQSILACSYNDLEAVALVQSSPDLDWKIDPMLADGGFQLACLLGNQHYKRPSLPVKIGKCTLHPGSITPECLCRVEFSRINKLGYAFNVHIASSQQEPLYSFWDNKAFFRI